MFTRLYKMDYCQATTGLRNTLPIIIATALHDLRTVTKNCNYGGGGEELSRRVLEIGTNTLFVCLCRYSY